MHSRNLARNHVGDLASSGGKERVIFTSLVSCQEAISLVLIMELSSRDVTFDWRALSRAHFQIHLLEWWNLQTLPRYTHILGEAVA